MNSMNVNVGTQVCVSWKIHRTSTSDTSCNTSVYTPSGF